MAILVLVISLSFWFLKFIQEQKKINPTLLGGNFILIDQNGREYNSIKIKKKN